MILDGNGSALTPALIDYACSQIPDHLRSGAYWRISWERFRVLLASGRPSDGIELRLYGMPVQHDRRLQDDAVFIYGGENGATQLLTIKNLATLERLPS